MVNKLIVLLVGGCFLVGSCSQLKPQRNRNTKINSTFSFLSTNDSQGDDKNKSPQLDQDLNPKAAYSFHQETKKLTLCLDKACHLENITSQISLEEFDPTALDLKFKFFAKKSAFDFTNNQYLSSVFITVDDLTNYNQGSSSFDVFKNDFDVFVASLTNSYKQAQLSTDSNYLGSNPRHFDNYPVHYPMIFRDLDRTGSTNSSISADLSGLNNEQKVEIEITSDFSNNRGKAGYQALKILPSKIKSLRLKYDVANIIILFTSDHLLQSPGGKTYIDPEIVSDWNQLRFDHTIMFVAMYDQNDQQQIDQWKEFFEKILPQADNFQKVSLSKLSSSDNKFDGLSQVLSSFENKAELCVWLDLDFSIPSIKISQQKAHTSFENWKSSGLEEPILNFDDLLDGAKPQGILKNKDLTIYNYFCCVSQRGYQKLNDYTGEKSSTEKGNNCNVIGYSTSNYGFR